MKDWTNEDLAAFFQQSENYQLLYLYTPLCGTCNVAGRMLEIVEKLLPQFVWGKCDLNYFPDEAVAWQIESVPCLVIFKGTTIVEKIYAFHSVTYLYEKLNGLSAGE